MSLFGKKKASKDGNIPVLVSLPVFPVQRWSVALMAFCFFSFAYSQQRELTGVINDDNGVPLPGVNITIQDSDRGTQTDFDGNFSIMVENGEVVEVNFIGFKEEKITVDDNLDVLELVLEEDVGTLEEVVVTGYGRQTRNTLTTAISKMDTEVLQSSTRSNAATALQGEVPGLRITNETGQPGSTPKIQLRGGTDFDGSGDPLILIDGVPGSFYALNSDDIESMEVLKDAAATAIYGARAANGVILITTKTGKAGKSSITYKQKYSFNFRRTAGPYIGAEDFIRYNRQAVAYYREAQNDPGGFDNFLDGALAFGTGNNATSSPFTVQFLNSDNQHLLNQPGWATMEDPLNPGKEILYRDTRLGEQIWQHSMSKDHYLSFQGGNEQGTYYASMGYLDNEGLILGSGFERFSGKFSGSYKIKDNFKVNSSLIYGHSKLHESPLGDNNTVFHRFAGQAPTARIYENNPDGTLSEELVPGTNRGFGNPLYYQDKFIRDNLEQRLTATMGFEWNIIPDLTLMANGSHFAVNNLVENFDKAFMDGGVYDDTRWSQDIVEKTRTLQMNASLNYRKKFGDHNFDALVGTEYYNTQDYSLTAATKNSPTDIIPTLNAGAEADGVPSSVRTRHVITSLFGRLNYDFDSRFLMQFNFRYDGSSRLDQNKFGFFPGISLGWNAHDEEFFQNWGVSNVVSKFKPRVSYGVNGNVDVLGNYTVYGRYGGPDPQNQPDLAYIYDGHGGYVNTELPLPNLQWEKSKTLNFGLDFSLFDDRLSFMADYFIRDVEDKLSGLLLPHWTGFSSITVNNGTLRNKGFELEVNANIVNTEDWQWNLRGNLATIKNYAHKLPENDNERNRQGGTQIYNPKTGEIEWVGGLQEGKRVGEDLVITYVQDHVYRDQPDVDKDAEIVDELLPNPTKRYPGDVKWVDTNEDGKINSYDRQIIGRTTPDFYGGISTDVRYKNISLYVKTDFSMGAIAYNHIRGKGLMQTQGNENQDVKVLDSWTPENPDTDVPRLVFVDAQNNIKRGDEETVNSRFWEKADYLAIREVTLSYDLPVDRWFNSFIDQLEVYVTGSNLYYFKEYSGPMPETAGYQYGEFPLPRTLTLGFNLTF